MELSGIRLRDIDMEQSRLFVFRGKGRKDRVVPIGCRALVALRRYLQELRPKLLTVEPTERVFLTAQGKPLGPERLTELVRDQVAKAGLRLRGACHLFRHSCATLMLENGADIRIIQQLLGHEQLTTTQLYTYVSIAQLQRVHARTHPAEQHSPPPSPSSEMYENPS